MPGHLPTIDRREQHTDVSGLKDRKQCELFWTCKQREQNQSVFSCFQSYTIIAAVIEVITSLELRRMVRHEYGSMERYTGLRSLPGMGDHE